MKKLLNRDALVLIVVVAFLALFSAVFAVDDSSSDAETESDDAVIEEAF